MVCRICQKDNPNEALFCSSCGAAVNGSAVNEITYTEMPMVDFGAAIRLGFQRYTDFTGRSTRAEYWWWSLFTFIVSLILIPLDAATGTFDETASMGLFGALFTVVTTIPSISVGVRRLHDINKSGWWILLWLVFVLGWIIVIKWAVEKGDKSVNKYGANPRQSASR